MSSMNLVEVNARAFGNEPADDRIEQQHDTDESASSIQRLIFNPGSSQCASLQAR